MFVVAGHTKFGRTAAVVLGSLDSVHTIGTNGQTRLGIVNAMQGKGIRLFGA